MYGTRSRQENGSYPIKLYVFLFMWEEEVPSGICKSSRESNKGSLRWWLSVLSLTPFISSSTAVALDSVLLHRSSSAGRR